MARDEELFGSLVLWGLMLIAILLGIWLLNPIVTINAGYRGVLTEWGEAKGVLPEGLSFKVPISQGVQIISVQTQKYEDDTYAASKDLQDVKTTIAINYHIRPENVLALYRDVGMDYAARVMHPAIQESTKAITAQFTAEELITKRQVVKDQIEKAVYDRLDKYGIYTEQTSITNFNFSEQFTQAIEAKVSAEQNALRAENDLKRVRIEAEQKVAQAQAEAESIRIQAEELKKSDQILTLRWIEKWNGQVPQTVVGLNENSTMIMGLGK